MRNAEQKLVAAKKVEKRLASKILRCKQTNKNEIIRLKDAIDEKDGLIKQYETKLKASEASVIKFRTELATVALIVVTLKRS